MYVLYIHICTVQSFFITRLIFFFIAALQVGDFTHLGNDNSILRQIVSTSLKPRVYYFQLAVLNSKLLTTPTSLATLGIA